ncbi:cadherin-5 [Melanotaenia boesemani]|uniref:cadherin-5 n=1 Tax=Melanotaenia boesemani TaxID=1250792 RepID=UPI001C05BAAD|nr:cadherin-5 [Melanotaenia boesemani]
MADTTVEGVQWSVAGKDADWFYLDERNIRLNASSDKILDREALGPVLMAELSCHEEDIHQSVYRLMVEILNENDNFPLFTENTSRSLIISELIPVNSVVFTVLATDADNDKIIYSVDQTSPDAEYFKVNLPNSGEVILSKPLDYETKTLLNVTIYASEMNTAEHYNTSINIAITILDGDDQYPQFLPCMLLFQDENSRICTSPVYMVNVTEGEEDIVLDFFPGPIQAVDGDRGLSSPVSYAILSGDDDGRFRIDKETGEMRLAQGVRDRLISPVLRLQVMAYQDNDPRKYSVATVLVRVLAVNRFYPEFDMDEYHGFVTAGKSPVSLVNTYGSKALMLHVHDQDFNQGFNPMIYFTFTPTSNHTDIYQVTQGGLLIAKTSRVTPKEKHILEVTAVDQESGDTTFTTVVVEVLTEEQSIPHSPLGLGRLTGCTVGKALFLSMVIMTLLGCVLSMLMWLKRKHKGMRDPLERGCVAQGKHPNVSLRWFQLVNHRSAMAHMEEVSYNSEEYGTCNPSFSFSDKPVFYTKQDTHLCQEPTSHRPVSPFDTNFIPTETLCSPVILNKNALELTKTSSSSPTFHPTREELNLTHVDQDAAPPNENPDLLPDVTSEPVEAQSNTLPGPATHDDPRPSYLTVPESETTSNNNIVEQVTSPSSPSSTPCSHFQMTSAEMDKPLVKTCEMTPPHSPLQSSPLPKEKGTPPPTPEHGLLKATLVHIDTSPTDTPPETPGRAAEIAKANPPCTSLDQTDQSELTGGIADATSPSQDRRPSTNSGNTQEDPGVGNGDDDGFLGDEDADKNSEGEDELESDEEELLRVMARCNPIFITFSK